MKDGDCENGRKKPVDEEDLIIGIKDKFKISDPAYHELHIVVNELPSRLYYLKQERERLSSAFTILEPFPVSILYLEFSSKCSYYHNL